MRPRGEEEPCLPGEELHLPPALSQLQAQVEVIWGVTGRGQLLPQSPLQPLAAHLCGHELISIEIGSCIIPMDSLF